jgi:hypothetical protein
MERSEYLANLHLATTLPRGTQKLVRRPVSPPAVRPHYVAALIVTVILALCV